MVHKVTGGNEYHAELTRQVNLMFIKVRTHRFFRAVDDDVRTVFVNVLVHPLDSLAILVRLHLGEVKRCAGGVVFAARRRVAVWRVGRGGMDVIDGIAVLAVFRRKDAGGEGVAAGLKRQIGNYT